MMLSRYQSSACGGLPLGVVGQKVTGAWILSEEIQQLSADAVRQQWQYEMRAFAGLFR